jgi:hypothetical protein
VIAEIVIAAKIAVCSVTDQTAGYLRKILGGMVVWILETLESPGFDKNNENGKRAVSQF